MTFDKDEILRRAAEAASNAQPQPPQVQPQPVPMAVQIGQGQMPDGGLAVVLIFQTPVGQNVFFLDANTAKSVSEGLQRYAQMSGSGLVVPS